MTSIAIITYTRANENLTKELVDISNKISSLNYDVTMEWYSEIETIFPSDIDFNICQTVIAGTKYRKLTHLLNNKGYDYLISLDNDVEANATEFLAWVQHTITHQYDLSWGCVQSRNVNNFVSNLVHIDKLLSHNILRPLLWKLNVGVTIPGQCFMLKNKTFKNNLPNTDTFLDDISIGLFAAKNKLSYLYLHEVIVTETPSYSFSNLLNQRARWATGYKQSLSCKSLSRKDRNLLYIHGGTYHILPLVNIILLVFLLTSFPALFIALLLSNAFLISIGNFKSFFYAIIYQIVFPLFHINWLKELIKG